MNNKNISVLRKDLFNTIDNVIEFNDKVTVNTKKGNAIIISESEYNSLIETLYIMSHKGTFNEIIEGLKQDPDTMSVYNPNEEW